MTQDTCLGCSGGAAPPLRKSDLESPCRTRSPHSLQVQRSYLRQLQQNKYYSQYKNILYNMHECEEHFGMIAMA
jgi:hypothetical protein